MWRSRLLAWQRSGQTAEAFCADKPYAASTLRWWSSRLRHAPGPAFIELRPRAEVVPTAPVAEIVVEVGTARVRVSPGFDPALLAAVVTAIGGGAR